MRYILLLACAGLLFTETVTPGDSPSDQDGGSGKTRRLPLVAAGPLKEGFTRIIGARFLDIDGNIRNLGDENGAGPAALVFVDDECPVSARYLGELNDFAAASEAAGVDFYAVVSSPFRTWADARRLRDDYGLRMPVLFDPSGDLAARLGPVTLAESFLISEQDRMIYRGRIGFYFSDRPTPEYIDGLLIGTQDLDIPPGDRAYVRHISMNVPVGFRLVDAMPHMHYIGSKARMVVTFPDGRRHSVFGIEDWDLRWQNVYSLRTPLHIPTGSRLDAWFVWDNSAKNFDNPFDPPQPIRWGWKSEEEMAEVWLGVIPDDPSRRLELIEAANATWYHADSQPLP